MRPVEAELAPPCAEERLPMLEDMAVPGPSLGRLVIQPRRRFDGVSRLAQHRLGGEVRIAMPGCLGRRMLDEPLGKARLLRRRT